MQDEEWRTVYVGFVERGTTEQELADHFKVFSRLLFFFCESTIKDFMLRHSFQLGISEVKGSKSLFFLSI